MRDCVATIVIIQVLRRYFLGVKKALRKLPAGFVQVPTSKPVSFYIEMKRGKRRRRGPVELDHTFAAPAGTFSVEETHVPTDVLGSEAAV